MSTLISCLIDSITPLTHEVFRVRFLRPDDSETTFNGGQYLSLKLQDNNFYPFSIASPPEEKKFFELHIRRIPGHQFAYDLLTFLQNEKTVDLEIPCGRCVLRASNREKVFIAGGTGFSPIKSMLESSWHKQENYFMHLYWGADSYQSLYLNELPEKWQKQYDSFHYTPVISGKDPKWQGKRGLVHKVTIEDKTNLSDCDIYISGSEAMVLAAYKDLKTIKIPDSQIFSDILDIKRDLGEL